MPRRRATLPHPRRVELCRATLAAGALLALTTSAFSQATKQNTAVLNTLQPHSVRTSLRTFHDETTEPSVSQSAAPAKTQDNPRGVCLAKVASAAASIAACNTYIQAAGRRWDGLAPAFSRRAEAYRAQGDLDAAIADFNRAIKVDPKKIDNFLGRGQAYLEKHDTALAIRDFSQAISLDSR